MPTPASSSTSRTAPASGASPNPRKPPGTSQAPTPGGSRRLTSSTRPSDGPRPPRHSASSRGRSFCGRQRTSGRNPNPSLGRVRRRRTDSIDTHPRSRTCSRETTRCRRAARVRRRPCPPCHAERTRGTSRESCAGYPRRSGPLRSVGEGLVPSCRCTRDMPRPPRAATGAAPTGDSPPTPNPWSVTPGTRDPRPGTLAQPSVPLTPVTASVDRPGRAPARTACTPSRFAASAVPRCPGRRSGPRPR